MVASVGKIVGIITGSFFAFLILFVLYLRISMGVFKHTFDRWYRAISPLRDHRRTHVHVVEPHNEPRQVEQMSSIAHVPLASARRASFDSALTGTTLVSPGTAVRPDLPPPRTNQVTRDDSMRRDLQLYASSLAIAYFV